MFIMDANTDRYNCNCILPNPLITETVTLFQQAITTDNPITALSSKGINTRLPIQTLYTVFDISIIPKITIVVANQSHFMYLYVRIIQGKSSFT